MKQNLQRPLIWIAALLASVPAAFAATAPALLQPFVEVFGPGGIGALYLSAPYLWDSILVAVLFISLGVSILGSRFNSKAVGVVVGLILTIAYSVFAYTSGFNFGDVHVQGFVLLLIFVVLNFFLYGLLHPKVIESRIIAFLLPFTLLWALMPPSWKATLDQSGVSAWFALIWAFSVIGLIGYGIYSLVQRSNSSSHNASDRGESRRFLGRRKRWSDDESNAIRQTLQDLRSAEERERSPQTQQARAASAAEIDQLTRDAAADSERAAGEEGELAGIAEGMDQANTILDQAVQGLDQTAGNGDAQKQFTEQIRSYKERWGQFMQGLQSRMQNAGNQLAQPDAVARDEEIEEGLFRRIEQLELWEYRSDDKIIKEIETVEKQLESEFGNLQRALQRLQQKAIDAPVRISREVVNNKENLDQVAKELAYVKDMHGKLTQNTQQLRDAKREIHDRIAKRKSVRESAWKTFMPIPAQFQQYTIDSLTSIDFAEKPRLSQAHAEGKRIAQELKQVLRDTQTIRTLDGEAMQLEEQLKANLQAHQQLEEQFFPANQDLLARCVSLLQLAEAASTALEGTEMVGDEFALKEQTFHVQLSKAGLKPLFKKHIEHNTETIKKLISEKLNPLITALEEKARNMPPGTQKNYYSLGAEELTELHGRTVQKWQQYINEQTTKNQEYLDRAQKSGFNEMNRRAAQ